MRSGANASPALATVGAPRTVVTLAGDVVLGSGSQLNLGNGFNPAQGDSFRLLAAGTQTGTFANVQLPAPADGLTWDTGALNGYGVITAVPEPSAWVAVALGAGLCVLATATRRRHAVHAARLR